MHHQLLLGPSRFEKLNQVRRSDHVHSQPAHQLHRPRIHHRDIRHRAIRRILHGHAAPTANERLQSIHQRAPTRVKCNAARERRQRLRLDLVHQSARFATGRNVVKPAPRHHRSWRELQHPVSQRIPSMVIEKQPPVEPFVSQRRLNLFESHPYETIIPRCENSSAIRRAKAPRNRSGRTDRSQTAPHFRNAFPPPHAASLSQAVVESPTPTR